jgi:hypothetical protein
MRTIGQKARLTGVLCSALALCALAASWALAGDEVLSKEMHRRVFFVESTGSVNSKLTFSGARQQVTITHAPPGATNPYLVVITPMPAQIGKNSFYWNSQETSMDVAANNIKSVLRTNGARHSGLHFFYMSPALYKSKTGPTHRDAERIKWVDTHATPIRITAQDASLTLRVLANSVSGTVAIHGFDDRAHAPVVFTASFQGYEYVPEEPKR